MPLARPGDTLHPHASSCSLLLLRWVQLCD